MKFRAIELIRAGWGGVLLAAPAEVLSHIHGVRVDRKAIVVTRILGARHLVRRRRRGRPRPGGAGGRGLGRHGALGDRARPGPRRPAPGPRRVTDAVVAASWAFLGWRHLRTGQARTGALRGRDRLARAVLRALPGGRTLVAQAQAVRAD